MATQRHTFEEAKELIRFKPISDTGGRQVNVASLGDYGLFNEYVRHRMPRNPLYPTSCWYLCFCVRNEEGKMLFPPRDSGDEGVEDLDENGEPFIRVPEDGIRKMLPDGAEPFDCGYGWSCWCVSVQDDMDLAIKVALEFDYNRRPNSFPSAKAADGCKERTDGMKEMTKEGLAALMGGREHTGEINPAEEEIAKRNNLLVFFGASDDLLEVRGAAHDEFGAYDGTVVKFDKDGNTIAAPEHCNECEDCEHFKRHSDAKKRFEVKAEWSPNGVKTSWRITADVPFVPFNVMEDGKLFCIGAVIDLDEVNGKEAAQC